MTDTERTSESFADTVEQAAVIRQAAQRTRRGAAIPKYPPLNGAPLSALSPATEQEQAERMNGFRKIVAEKQFQPVRWIDRDGKRRSLSVDLTTASVVCQVYDSISPEHRARLCKFEPIGIVRVALALLGR